MFGLEPWHIVLLLAVLLVIFGPKRLPEIGKNLGESIREFRKATTEFGDSVKAGASPPTVPPTVPPTAPQPTAPITVVPPVASVPAAGQETQPAASSGTPQPPTPPTATAG